MTRYANEALIDISLNSNWEELIPVGEGRAYGLEFSLAQNMGNTDFELAYTLSWSDRQFDGLNNGERFRFRFDRRHVLNLSLVQQLGHSVDFSANWQFGSGAPVTIPTGSRYYDYDPNTSQERLVLVYDGINNDVLPAYHRLDLGFNFRTDYDWGKTRFTLGLYNAYNRQNTFYRDVIVDLNNPENRLNFEDITLLPILPTISYSVDF